MNRYGPVRGYYPWEDELIRNADSQSINACAAFLCRDSATIRKRALALRAKARASARREKMRERGFVRVDWLVRPAPEVRA